MFSEDITKKIEEIEKASLAIPFGNSKFQNENFVMAGEITPARAYRHCLLRLNDRLTALRECYYNLQLEIIDIEELEEKNLDENINKFEKRRNLLTIEKKRTEREHNSKLVSDCMKEIDTLYNAFTQFKKYTNEEFEAEEKLHFELKLGRDILLGNNGAMLSLDSMGALSLLKDKAGLERALDCAKLQLPKAVI